MKAKFVGCPDSNRKLAILVRLGPYGEAVLLDAATTKTVCCRKWASSPTAKPLMDRHFGRSLFFGEAQPGCWGPSPMPGRRTDGGRFPGRIVAFSWGTGSRVRHLFGSILIYLSRYREWIAPLWRSGWRSAGHQGAAAKLDQLHCARHW